MYFKHKTSEVPIIIEVLGGQNISIYNPHNPYEDGASREFVYYRNMLTGFENAFPKDTLDEDYEYISDEDIEMELLKVI